MLLFVFFISLLIVAPHVSGNHVPIIRSWRLRDVIASCWYVPWLQGGCQDRLAGSASIGRTTCQPVLTIWIIFKSVYGGCLYLWSLRIDSENLSFYLCVPRRRMGVWSLVPFFLNLGTRWRWMVRFTFWPFCLCGWCAVNRFNWRLIRPLNRWLMGWEG